MNWLLKLCGYEHYRDKIQNLSLRNPMPFKGWFAGSENGRVYLPFNVVDVKVDDMVESVIKDQGCSITDYRVGLCECSGRIYKIPKIIERAKKKELQELQQKNERGEVYNFADDSKKIERIYNDILRTFVSSPSRMNKDQNQYSIVISQNPHDIASMSTGRSWTSCMELGKGAHYEDVFCEVESGGLVAYLINSGDLDIKKPIARIHIRRFENKDGVNIAVPEKSVYGNNLSGFDVAVQNWIRSKQGDIAAGTYNRRGGNYSDTFGDFYLQMPTDPETVIKWLHGDGDGAKETVWTIDGLEYYELESPTFNSYESAELYLENLHENSDFDPDIVERFEPDIIERVVDHTREMRTRAINQIVESPVGTYPKEVLLEVKNYLTGVNEHVFQMPSLLPEFIKKYKSLFSRSELEELNKKFNNHRFFDQMWESFSDEEKNLYRQDVSNSVLRELQNPYAFFVREKPNTPIGRLTIGRLTNNDSKYKYGYYPDDSESMYFNINFGEKILEPLRRVFSPIPEPIIQKLVEFADKVPSLNLYRGESKAIRGKQTDYEDQLLSRMAQIFFITKSDTPTVINFYKSLLPRWRDSFGSDFSTYGDLNVSTLGLYLCSLGAMAKDFVPFLTEKLEKAKSKRLVIYNDPKSMDWAKRSVDKEIEQYLYCIDAIKNGTGDSRKYKFFREASNWLVKMCQTDPWADFSYRKGTGDDPSPLDTPPQRTENGDFVFYHGTRLELAKKILNERRIGPDDWNMAGINTTISNAATYASMAAAKTRNTVKDKSAIVGLVVDRNWLSKQQIRREIGGRGVDSWLVPKEIPSAAIKRIWIVRIAGEDTSMYFGYRIVSFDGKQAYSLQNKKIVNLQVGSTDMNVYLGTSKQFCIDHYAGLTDEKDLLLTYSYSSDDIISGQTDSNGEVLVKEAILEQVEHI